MGAVVSVVLSVYNGESTIQRAVESILLQSYRDFELTVINDGSNDGTARILKGLTDSRIRVVEQGNLGLVRSLNRGILGSTGKYIARMDADDVALPERFARQVEFLEDNPSIAVVGTAVRCIYPDGTVRIRYRPLNTEMIRRNLVRINPFCHSSVMIRRDVLDRVGLYDEEKDSSKKLLVEDYDLWARILVAGYEMANLPDVLMEIHREPQSVMRGRSPRKRILQQILSRVYVIRALNLGPISYLNLIPVVILGFASNYGLRLDRVFNALSLRKSRRRLPPA